MDGVLSQEEINALLNDTSSDDFKDEEVTQLTEEEKDAIGEVSNISMGTAATTLFSLVNRKVDISTPVVEYVTWDDIVDNYELPCVFIRIAYTQGLDGSNIMVLKEKDVKIITDLMMGGDGANTDGELGELHLSAICEAMNQMMGSSATSLSTMLDKTIDISPPSADVVDFTQKMDGAEIEEFLQGHFVKISFKIKIGNLVDSEIMQLYPYSFAKEMYECMAKNLEVDMPQEEAPGNSNQQQVSNEQQINNGGQQQIQPNMGQQQMPPNMGQQQMPPNMGQQQMQPNMGQQQMSPNMGQQMNYGQPFQPVNVQNAQFQNFTSDFVTAGQKENIDLIMDVPLEVTVELGRTKKSIKDILEFSPGTIIELNKIAGEPIDVLVNGKYVATGEVVVIEENFGVRITDIIKTTSREII